MESRKKPGTTDEWEEHIIDLKLLRRGEQYLKRAIEVSDNPRKDVKELNTFYDLERKSSR